MLNVFVRDLMLVINWSMFALLTLYSDSLYLTSDTVDSIDWLA